MVGMSHRRRSSVRLTLPLLLLFVPACGGTSDGASDPLADGLAQTASALTGTLTVAPIFGSNMVLQQGTAVPVFGTADPGAAVDVTFLAQTVSAVADGAGRWVATLAAMPANATPSSLVVSSSAGTVTLGGVQVGEVWLCSGQSNMGKPLSYADGSAPYIADAPNHDVRLFRMTANNGPATTTWQISNATTAASFSAVCYFMGLDLSEDMNVPVGLIQATLDGSDIADWEHNNGGSGASYDAMVRPIQPLAVKGVAWYQGESNGGDAAYEVKLTAMIAEWRNDWGFAALPFGIVQLPATKWSTAKLAQYEVTQAVPNTFLAVTADLPGGNQLHPTAKYLVGMRTSIGARGSVYAEPIEYSGPAPAASSSVSGGTVTLNFDHVGSALATSDGQAPSSFQLAGSNNRYVPGTAVRLGNSIQVSSSRVAAPKHVRYGFSEVGNVVSTVNVPTEGGTHSVATLPGSLYQLDFP
jgi:sialate O-acetylesterase